MQRKVSWLLPAAAVAAAFAAGGCVVVPPRARVAVVAPVRVWVPGYWGHGHVWIDGYWRYR